MRLIHHITHHVALGWLDRLAGALFGAVKYLVILSIVLNLVHIIDPKGKLIPKKETASSQFYGYTLRVAPLLFSMAQEQFGNQTDEGIVYTLFDMQRAVSLL